MKFLLKNIRFNYASLSNYQIIFILFGLALFIRFPFFFRDYIDHDESTFILMGQSLADGYLPYTELWDLKPPGVFFLLGGLISIFGKSFVVIRLVGVIVVAATSYYIYKIADHYFNKPAAFWSAILYILLSSLFGSLQGLMTEHLSMLFLIPGLWILIKKQSAGYLFLSGIIMGISLMMKLNLAFAILMINFGLLIIYIREGVGLKTTFLRVFLFGLGVVVSVFCTIIPYMAQGKTTIWFKSVLLAAWSYDEVGNTNNLHVLAVLFPIIIFITYIFLFRHSRYFVRNSTHVSILFIAFLGIAISFIKAGEINGH